MSVTVQSLWRAIAVGAVATIVPVPGAMAAAQRPVQLAQAESPVVTQALQDIARFEGLAAAMVPGDKAAGRKYMTDLGAIGTRLRTAPASDPRLAGAVERFNALQKKVVDTANAAPGTAPGAAPPTAAGGAPAPAAAPARLTSSDQARFNRVQGNIRSLAQRVEGANLQTLLDEREVTALRNSVANNRGDLDGFPADAQGVAEEKANLDAVAAKLDAKLADAKAKGGALGDVEAQLTAMEARVRANPVPSPQAFKPEAGPEAAGKLVQSLVAIKAESVADAATLDKLTAAGIKDQRIDRLRAWAGAERQRQVDETLRAVGQANDAAIARGLEAANFHAATDPAQQDHRANRLLGDGRRAAALAEFDRGLAAVDTAAAIDAAQARKDGPDRAQQKQTLTAARAAYEQKHRVAVGLVRVPPAGMTDEKLLVAAREALADPKTGAKPAKRMVVNSKQVERKEKREADINVGTVTTTATIYHWIWEEYQVTTVEAVGDQHYLFYNTLKFFQQGAPTTPTNRWVLADRFQGEPILAENIDK